MRRFSLVVAALIMSCSLLPTSARADADGCIALGTHAGGAQCTYTATGAGNWVATTLNPFKITIWTGQTSVVRDTIQRGTAGTSNAEGILLSLPGDRVDVSITCWDWSHMNQSCLGAGGRDGAVIAQSQL